MTKDVSRFVAAEQALWSKFGITPSERRVTLPAGNEVRLQEIGDGPPILFLHGATPGQAKSASVPHRGPPSADLPAMRHRHLVGATAVAALGFLVLGVLRSLPAAACSQPGPSFEELTLENVDEANVAAIGHAEIVARTGWTWRWHRAGVVAFTEAWPLQDDLAAVTETVWTIDDGRNNGGDCYFGRDAEPIGSRQGLHVLLEDGVVLRLTGASEDHFGPVDPGELTARYGEPVSVAPDPGHVEAALAPLVAERRGAYWTGRVAIALAVGALVLLVIRRRVHDERRRLPRRNQPS